MAAQRGPEEDEDGLPENTCKAVFASYVCRSLPFKAHKHPGDVAEATSLSSVLLPATEYPLLDSIPCNLVETGKLSQLQLEGILQACNRHMEILPNGKRAGFFIGDGAGVGKGRQIAGCIIDNFARGRKQHAWLSISSDLHLDAQRDLTDLGCFIKVINNVQTLDRETKALGLSSDFKEGVLFLTYSSLISTIKGKARLDQIVQWLGGSSFDGLLVFDECHKAKNFSPGKEAASTKIATCVLELQHRLPHARVLYCSATGVSEVGNMAYMDRMNLWGPGTAFRDFEQFLDSMKNQSVSFLELLATEMKAQGKYVARGLSFKDAEFSEIECLLTAKQIQMYDAAVHVWSKIKSGLHATLVLTGSSPRDVMKIFWSTMQRFFKLLCISLKVPRLVEEAKKALAEGMCVVVGLQSTGESADTSLGLKPGPVPGMVSTTKEMLVRFVRAHIPFRKKDGSKGREGDEALESGEASEQPDTLGGADSHITTAGYEEGKNEDTTTQMDCVSRECKVIQEELFEAIQGLELPPNFLDEIIDELGGPSQVAEMTGRRGRIVRGPREGTYTYELRAKPESDALDSLNVVERGYFMSGMRPVAIISDAASTGISLHASRETPNPKRRLHLTIELPWSADKAIQQLGRTHRSNQVSAPVYRLLSTSVGGEKRFAAAVARRLQSLGALTRGDRRAASGVDLSEQNFDSPLGRRSLRRMYDHIVLESPTMPAGTDLVAILKEFVKAEAGRLDMDYAEAEALISVDDPELLAIKVSLLHKQLRQYVDVMGVDVSSSKKDTVAEEGDSVSKASKAQPNKGKGSKDTVKVRETGDVKRFLNRLLGLPVAEQNLIFAYFTAVLAAEIRAAKQEGKYSEGLSDLFGSNCVRHKTAGAGRGLHDRSVLWEDPISGLKTYRNEFFVDRGMSWEAAVAKLQHEARQGDCSGFCISRRPFYSKHTVCLALQKPGARNLFSISRPNTGDSFMDFERENLESKYQLVSMEKAEAEWRSSYEQALELCMHGPNCKQGDSCTHGKRITHVTLLSGSVVRVWGILEAVLSRHEHEVSKADRAMRVVRAATGPQTDRTPSVSAAPTPSKAPLDPSISSASQQGEAGASKQPGSSAPAAGVTAGTPATIVPAMSVHGVQNESAAAGADLEALTAADGILPLSSGEAAPEHVVGVRYPGVLLPEVVATLHSLLYAATDRAGASNPVSAMAGMTAAQPGRGVAAGGGRMESPAKVDPKALAKAFRRPATIGDFFKKSSSQHSAAAGSGASGIHTDAAAYGATGRGGGGSSSNKAISKIPGEPSGGRGSGFSTDGVAKPLGKSTGSGGSVSKMDKRNTLPGQRSLGASFFGGSSQQQQQRVETIDLMDDDDEEVAKNTSKPKRVIEEVKGNGGGGNSINGNKAKRAKKVGEGMLSKEEKLKKLVEGMGFEGRQAERALMLSAGDVDKAVDMCLNGM